MFSDKICGNRLGLRQGFEMLRQQQVWESRLGILPSYSDRGAPSNGRAPLKKKTPGAKGGRPPRAKRLRADQFVNGGVVLKQTFYHQEVIQVLECVDRALSMREYVRCFC